MTTSKPSSDDATETYVSIVTENPVTRRLKFIISSTVSTTARITEETWFVYVTHAILSIITEKSN